MSLIALSVGAYSYLILTLGLFGLLNFSFVFSITLFFIIFVIWSLNQKTYYLLKLITHFKKIDFLLLAFIIISILINFIGVLGPELSFDALWYHLTIPKLFALNNRIYFIEGNLFYYSLMPKMTEMLYASSLLLGNEIIAKFIHYLFGIGTLIITYKIARIYLSRTYSFLASIVFYSNLVVGWLSISAYVDLSRTFFESLAVLNFLFFIKKNSLRYLIMSALFLGFAISVKLVSILSIGIFIALLFVSSRLIRDKLRNALIFLLITVFIPLPWFLISIYFSGNPIYPFFSDHAPQNQVFTNLLPHLVIKNVLSVFLFSNDPISPIYTIVGPLTILVYKRLLKYKGVLLYAALSLIIWYVSSFSGFWHGTDQAGSARFLVAYLPLLSVLVLLIVKSVKFEVLRKTILFIIILLAVLSAFYRLVANLKFIPVIINIESKEDFLMKNLNFSFGDFYDENGEIKKMVGDDMVLLHGLHNLYYIDFNYTIPEWDNKKNAKYLLLQKGDLSKEYESAKLIYSNKKTMVNLYKL